MKSQPSIGVAMSASMTSCVSVFLPILIFLVLVPNVGNWVLLTASSFNDVFKAASWYYVLG